MYRWLYIFIKVFSALFTVNNYFTSDVMTHIEFKLLWAAGVPLLSKKLYTILNSKRKLPRLNPNFRNQYIRNMILYPEVVCLNHLDQPH